MTISMEEYKDLDFSEVFVSENVVDYAQPLATDKVELDPLETARSIISDTSVNLFLTGKAGTGKTTFLRRLVAENPKRMVVLAPTGVAAINAGGSTIHSFFQLDFGPYIPDHGFGKQEGRKIHRFSKNKLSIIRTLDLLVIDEISMVRPDVLDAVDAVLRRHRNSLKPFGGVQLLLIGDLRQLAPVVQDQEWDILRQYYPTPYFFDSLALKKAGFLMVELTKVFRQSDPKFIAILNAIRTNTADFNILQELNKRAAPSLMPAEDEDEGYIRLTTHNYRADAINNRRMAKLTTPEVVFTATIEGKFPESSYPADVNLTLKQGAQVMFIKNDPSGNQEYYNGLIGEIVSLSENEVVVRPRKDGDIQHADIRVGCVSWENTRYEMDDNGEFRQKVEGMFSQVPLRLAWAITIHKSQGLTFDKAIVDAANSFAPGQTYVALSRCRSLEGLVLDFPLTGRSIMTDPQVNDFIQNQKRMEGNDNQLDTFRNAYHGEMLFEMFNFQTLDDLFDSYYRACVASLSSLFPQFMEKLNVWDGRFRKEIVDVAVKLFNFFSSALPHRSEERATALIDEKTKNGANYFYSRLIELSSLVNTTPLAIDNKVLLKRLVLNRDALWERLEQHIRILDHFRSFDFTPAEYMKVKTESLLLLEATAPKNRPPMPKKGSSANSGDSADEYIENAPLYYKLAEWRRKKAGTKPVFIVAGNKLLMAISSAMPETSEQLLAIKGMGRQKAEKYGEEILEIIRKYKASNP